VQDKVTLICKPHEVRLQLRDGFAKQLASESFIHSTPPMSPTSIFLAPPTSYEQDQQYRRHHHDTDPCSGITQSPSLREAIVTLLQTNLSSKEPNFTHFLLGLNLSQSKKRSRLESDSSSPRCLQVILSLLSNASFAHRHPRLCEMSYHFVHDLCYDPRSSATILRYLRTNETPFFSKQLSLFSSSLAALDNANLDYAQGWPSSSSSSSSSSVLSVSPSRSAVMASTMLGASPFASSLLSPATPTRHGTSAGATAGTDSTVPANVQARRAHDQMLQTLIFELRQRAWLLHTVALELHVTARSEQYMRTELLKFLFAASTESASSLATSTFMPPAQSTFLANSYGVIVCFHDTESDSEIC
jgi:hypothetical protein